MHIYAFGSICRGDVSKESDIDLLAVVDGFDPRFDPILFSIYSYKRIREIWLAGNPFAWHLHLEAKPLFLSDGSDFLKTLGAPARYVEHVRDCKKFLFLFMEARRSLERNSNSSVFDLSTIFLSIRNIATCFSLGKTSVPVFSRSSALRLGDRSLAIDDETYKIFEHARILCTRAKGSALEKHAIEQAISRLDHIGEWMEYLVMEAEKDG
jgi:predicted nucleotidyltransferase